ncbi:MAG: hypothetical protein V4568_18185 [Pseudomonadota bacterium]
MTIIQPPKLPDPKQCERSAREVNDAFPAPTPTGGRSSGGAAELGVIISGVIDYISGKSKEKECLKQQDIQYQKALSEYTEQIQSSNLSSWDTFVSSAWNLAKHIVSVESVIDMHEAQRSQQMEQFERNVEIFKERHVPRVEAPPIVEASPILQARPAPITPQFVYIQGVWMGPGGSVQSHYDPTNCVGGPGSGGGGGDGNGIDRGPSSGNGVNICMEFNDGHKSCTRY